MALAQLVVRPDVAGGRAAALTPQSCLVMELAMVAGLVAVYPVNWCLVRVGIKEAT